VVFIRFNGTSLEAMAVLNCIKADCPIVPAFNKLLANSAADVPD
jgi:hypothetical protein